MTTKPRVAVYVRASSKANESGISKQRASIQDYANANGYELDEDIVYSDVGSASKPHTRPGFLKLMDDIQAGKFNTIIVSDMDRLARNMLEHGMLMHLLQKGIIEIIVVKNNRKYTKDDHVLVWSIEFGMANQFMQPKRRRHQSNCDCCCCLSASGM